MTRSEIPTPVAERFWRYVVPMMDDRGCWEWTGALKGGSSLSYGIFGKHDRAHRVSWEINCGPIPAGLFVLHRCDNASCVNPRHLFLGTQRQNMHDMLAKGRSKTSEHLHKAVAASAEIRGKSEACKNGHRFDMIRKDGIRGCRTCNREKAARHLARKRSAI